MAQTTNREAVQSVVLIAGVYEGVLPFVSKAFGWHPFLAFPTRLDAPWWWLVSGLAVVAAVVGMVLLDRR